MAEEAEQQPAFRYVDGLKIYDNNTMLKDGDFFKHCERFTKVETLWIVERIIATKNDICQIRAKQVIVHPPDELFITNIWKLFDGDDITIHAVDDIGKNCTWKQGYMRVETLYIRDDRRSEEQYQDVFLPPKTALTAEELININDVEYLDETGMRNRLYDGMGTTNYMFTENGTSLTRQNIVNEFFKCLYSTSIEENAEEGENDDD